LGGPSKGKTLIVQILALVALAATRFAAPSLRSADFNNFTFPFHETQITLHRGKGTLTDPGDADSSIEFEGVTVIYGDLSDSGPEAVVSLGYHIRGHPSDLFREVYVYSRGPTGPRLLGTVSGSCCGCLNITKVGIHHHELVVERPTGRCSGHGPESITEYYRWNGEELDRIRTQDHPR
jgi:hypothetical protein